MSPLETAKKIYGIIRDDKEREEREQAAWDGILSKLRQAQAEAEEEDSE